MNYQTTMLNKLRLLHQRLNPSSTHSFLLPTYPGLPESGRPERQPSADAATNRKPSREKPRSGAAAVENSSSEVETYKCPICQRLFVHKGHFRRHMENSHGGMYQQQSSAPPTSEEYHCHYCDKVFVSKHRLRTHEHGHEGIRPYKCQICGKGFTQSGTCRRHERIHVGFKPFKCRFCNRTFLQTKELKKHEVLHLRELMSKEAVSCM